MSVCVCVCVFVRAGVLFGAESLEMRTTESRTDRRPAIVQLEARLPAVERRP